jgi:hypothetical protein
MNLETLINVILVVFFLLFTLLSKTLASRKKKTTGMQKKLSKNPLFSFFQKIRDQIQESIQELEKQARQEKQKQSADTDFWDELAEEDLAEEETPIAAEPPPVTSRSAAGEGLRTQKQIPRTSKKPLQDQTVPPPTIHPYGRRPSLRQAVIWAEIIGKPAALRKEHSDVII